MDRISNSFQLGPAGALLALLLVTPGLAAQVCSNLAGSSIYLARHAEKLDGRDPGLSDAGLARAEALREALADVALDAIYVTQWQRTQLTAKPLVDATGVPVTVLSTDLRSVDEHVEDIILDLNAKHCGNTVLLIGHSNTIPRIIYSLTGKQVDTLSEQTYNRLFHVRFEAGQPVQLIRLEFGAPNPTGTS